MWAVRWCHTVCNPGTKCIERSPPWDCSSFHSSSVRVSISHGTDYEEVLRSNKLGLSVCDFTSRLNVAVDTFLDTNVSVPKTPHAPEVTPTPMTGTVNPANGEGAGAHAATMARFAATTALFQAPTEQPTPRGKQISMSDMFQPSAAWTQGEDRHWKEQLVGLIAEQYLSFAIVALSSFRAVMGTWCLAERDGL